MKSARALLVASISLAGCAANQPSTSSQASQVTDQNVAAPSTAPVAQGSTDAHVYRGSIDVDGATYGIDVTLTLAQKVTQTKFCDLGGRGVASFGGVYLMPESMTSGGSIKSTVRGPDGNVLKEVTRDVTSFYAGTTADFASLCSAEGKVAKRDLVTELPLESLLVVIPGVAVDLPGGPLWLNPSYLGPTDAYLTVSGTVHYESLSDRTTVGPRPFASAGEELTFLDGKATVTPMSSFDVEVGTNLDATHSIAQTVRKITLAAR